MTITFTMITPANGARQVDVNTNIELEVNGTTSDGYGPSYDTLSVQINGIDAIRHGEFQSIRTLLAEDITSPTRYITLQGTADFIRGERVNIFDNNSITIVETRVLNVVGAVVELEQTVNDLTVDADARIESLTRGFGGSISGNTITINPRSSLKKNSVIIVTADLVSTNAFPTANDLVRGSFAFRTSDTIAPQIFNFPPTIEYSNLSFSIVDILNNGIVQNSLNVFLGSDQAIEDGYVTSNFMGSILVRNDSEFDIYLRPKAKFFDGEQINAQITVADGYGNQGLYTKKVLNRDRMPRLEFIDITPRPESVIDPLNAGFVIQLRTDQLLRREFINVDIELGDERFSIIKAGQFQICEACDPVATHTGTIRLGRDVYIEIDKILTIASLKAFSKAVKVELFLLEATPEGDVPIGAVPFYQKEFSYPTISSTIAPYIDSFFPTGDLIPVDTSIKFRALSRTTGVPIDLNAIIVAINSVVAIDNGVFREGFTGTIAVKQGSAGNTLNVVLFRTEPFAVGAMSQVDIQVSDVSGNTTSATFTFVVANTSLPTVTITPVGGTYKALTRIKLQSSQPAQIYYTIDGTTPRIGQLNTFVAVSPVLNVPIFKDGITQVKAFAVGVGGLSGPTAVEIYDLNPFIPEVIITSPLNNDFLDTGTVSVHYKISLLRGYLTKVEVVLNNGFVLDTQNTLLESDVFVTGLLSGTNTIQIRATDNAGNIGRARILVSVKPSQISEFSIAYAPLACPKFTTKTAPDTRSLVEFFDTSTVAVIGLGRRSETLIAFALGDGVDGSPIDFKTSNLPDGRHFELKAFPVKESSVRVNLFRHNQLLELVPTEYVFEPSSGQLVLDHPLERGENLTVDYIAEPDINTPRLVLPTDIVQAFQRYGTPNTENTLSLGMQLAFENGARRVLAVQALDLNEDANWSNSFRILEQEQCYWVTPVLNNDQLSFYPVVLQAAFNHATKMSQIKYRKERIVSGWRMPNALNDFGTARIFLAAIDQDPTITRIIQGEAAQLNGTFIAAAIAGCGSGLGPVSLPLTSKSLTGFQLGTTKRSPNLDLADLMKQGFLPVQALAAGASIFRGRSAYIGATDPVQEELSVQRTIDFVCKNLRKAVEDRFIGQLVTPDVLKRLKTAVNEFLAARSDMLSSGQVTNLVVDPFDPRQVDIQVTMNPLYPLNEFQITTSLAVTL